MGGPVIMVHNNFYGVLLRETSVTNIWRKNVNIYLPTSFNALLRSGHHAYHAILATIDCRTENQHGCICKAEAVVLTVG
jgi:hypothetical protein